MDFTTESLDYFFTEQISLSDDFADASSSSFKGFAVGTRFEQIPFWQDALFTWSICILSFILNLVVLLFYGKERKSSGVYLLVLAVVDIVAPILLLLPRFALAFVADPAARDVIVTGRHQRAATVGRGGGVPNRREQTARGISTVRAAGKWCCWGKECTCT